MTEPLGAPVRLAAFRWLDDQTAVHPPRRPELRPSRDLLALRYERFPGAS